MVNKSFTQVKYKTSYLIQVSGSNDKSKAVFINESGLYSLILSSKLEQAKAFKRWVTAEVLRLIMSKLQASQAPQTSYAFQAQHNL